MKIPSIDNIVTRFFIVLKPIFLYLAVIALSILVGLFFPLKVQSATIANVTVKGLNSMQEKELLELLDMRRGGRVDAEKIRQGIKRAFLKGIFDDISIVADDKDPADVIVTVRERDIIKDIKITGDYRLPVKTILNALIFKVGEIMRYDLLDEAEKGLRSLYAAAGYPASDIMFSTEKLSGNGKIAINVRIDAGIPLTIKLMKVSPNGRITKSDFKISEGDVYDQFRIKEEIDRIKELLKKEGYYHPAVGPYGYHEGEMSVVVDPGKRLNISIIGNSAISSKSIEKEMPFFETETFNDEIVDEAVSRITAIYKKEGYIYVQIAPVISESENEIKAEFFIYEGKRISIRNISFSGITYPDQSLKSIMQLKQGNYYDPALISQDMDSLREFYNALGYLDASVKKIDAVVAIDDGYADLNVLIEEGQRTTIASIEIKGADHDLSEKLLRLISIKPGDAYNDVDISDARFKLLAHYANEGFANIDIQVQRRIEGRSVHIIYNIIEGKKKTIGKTIIVGNRNTRYEAIRRELVHNEGDAYNFRALSDIRQRLYKLGLFTEVEVEPYDTTEETKDLLVRLKEGNAGAFEFGLGLADYEGVRGFAELSYRNLFGMNRQGIIRTELSALEDRIILQYYEPWLFGRPLPFRAIFLREDKTEITIPGRQVRYRLQRYSVSAGVEKKLNDAMKTELYYEFSLVKTTDIQPDVILSKEDIGTVAISAIRPAIVYDTRNDPFEPTSGVVAGLTAKFASDLLFSETNFAKFSIYANYFHQLRKDIVLALSMRGGVAYGFSATEELPIVERFFLGGRSTVRGYEQDMLGPKGADGNPTGGNAFAMGSVELRTSIGKGVSIVPFFDFGNVWIKTSDGRPNNLKYTAGLGLRYATPVGPLRVDYGFKLNKDPNESGGEIHFSVGHAF